MVQPFKDVSLGEVCREYFHVKHLLFWILSVVNYGLLFTIHCCFGTNGLWECVVLYLVQF